MMIEVMVAPGFEGVVNAIIEELRDELKIAKVRRPENLEPL